MLSQSIRTSRGFLNRLTPRRACTTYEEVLAGRKHHVPEEPKSSTTILLRNLPSSAVLDSVKKAVESTRPHRVALEPGCAIHVAREDEANTALSNLVTGLNLQCRVKQASMPSLVLHNISNAVSADMLKNTFAQYHPAVVRIVGDRSLQIGVMTGNESLTLSKKIEQIEINGRKLITHSVKAPNEKFSIIVSNFPADVNIDAAKEMLSTATGVPSEQIVESSAVHTTVNVRLGYVPEDKLQQVQEVIRELAYGNKTPLNVEFANVSKPALFLHGVEHIPDSDLADFKVQFNVERIQRTFRSEDYYGDVAIAYFSSKKDASACLAQLKKSKYREFKINASYREVNEPAVEVTGIDQNATKEDLMKLWRNYRINRIILSDIDPNTLTKKATVVVSSPREAETLARFTSDTIQNTSMKAKILGPLDAGVELTFADNEAPSAQDIEEALKKHNIFPKAVDVNTNKTAILGFIDADTVRRSSLSFYKAIESKDGPLCSTDVSVSLSTLPSYVVAVTGLREDQPASTVVDAIGDIAPLSVNRSATLKYKRANHTLAALKFLKKCEVDGTLIKANHYKPIHIENESEYDAADYEDGTAKFDGMVLHSLMKDYMHAEPALRYQIARNYFERALTSAKGADNVNFLLDDNAPPAMVQEVKQLMAQDKPDLSRLFNLFIQRSDMQRYTHDFREMKQLFGDANENDLFNWSTFTAADMDEMDKLYVDLFGHTMRQRKLDKLMKKKGTGGLNEHGEFIVTSDDGEEEAKVNFDFSRVRDYDGHTWSGIVVNNDTTQKTTPQGRVMTHRVLVMIGNLRGAGGFGKGKGDTEGAALNAAFRDALRNIQFVDLYDNFGLCHDVKAKHNGCYCYIRATPRSRMMIASPLASGILMRLGISTASVKLIGNRNPYSQVRSIFAALAKHENIDEIAKARGKRYMTLRWLYENAL